MTKRHLFKTSILAGLAAVCPIVAAPAVQSIDVAQWAHISIFGYGIDGVFRWQGGPIESFSKDDTWARDIVESPDAEFTLRNDETDLKISREQFKQLFNI